MHYVQKPCVERVQNFVVNVIPMIWVFHNLNLGLIATVNVLTFSLSMIMNKVDSDGKG